MFSALLLGILGIALGSAAMKKAGVICFLITTIIRSHPIDGLKTVQSP